MAYIALGSNLGDRLANCCAAVRAIVVGEGIRFDAEKDVAGLYESPPLGAYDQPQYLNSVIRVRTSLLPRDLLQCLLAIEDGLGRTRPGRWSSRTMDLDLLLYDELVIDEPDLIVPHPRLHERNFVLEPLAELAADFVHPVLRRTIADLAVCGMADNESSCLHRWAERGWFQPSTAG